MPSKKSSPRRRSKADREFVSEAEEILEAMRSGLADLSDAGDGDEADPQLVNAMFRSAHSLKALAGMFQFQPIETLAHGFEDVLDALRLGRVASSSSLLSLIEEIVALFAVLLERVGDAETLAESAERIESLSTRVQEAMHAPAAPADDFGGLDVDPAMLRALTEYEEHRLRENIKRGRHIALVEASFPIESFEDGLSELQAAVREKGEVLSTLPSPGDTLDAGIRFSLLIASQEGADRLGERLADIGASVRPVCAGGTAEDGDEAQTRGAAPLAAGDGEGAAAVEPEVDAPGLSSLRSISDTVRVDIRKLDELMNLVGELAIQRSAFGDLITRLEERPETARIGHEFAKLHKGLDRKLRELQSAVLEVRMVPLRQVFDKVSRVVRRLRRDLGKEVELEIHGADTELDKLIVEALVDPLMHVVRNSIDHAIEEPEPRIAAGKPANGRISIDAFQRGNHVVIEVRDDGAGIDTVALRARAEERGIVAAGEALDERETLDLIFAPGISTRSEVSETSGRGVGMDVVRENLSALGGVVDVDSTPGRGTTIAMTLPITLAIIQSLIVGARRQRFAVPLNAVLETLCIDESAVQRSEGREFLNLRGEPLALRRLAETFELEGDAPAERPFVIVLGHGDQRLGLLVDRLEGQQDTVIKPIQGPIQDLRGISGATELGDEDPVLVLDVSALIEDGARRREAA